MPIVIPVAGESFRVLKARNAPDVTEGKVYQMVTGKSNGPYFIDDAGDKNYSLSQFDSSRSARERDSSYLLEEPNQIEIV